MPERSTFGVGGHPDSETLAAYVDGALGVRASEDVEHHLMGCETCRDLVTGVTRTVAFERWAARRRWRIAEAAAAAAATAALIASSC